MRRDRGGPIWPMACMVALLGFVGLGSSCNEPSVVTPVREAPAGGGVPGIGDLRTIRIEPSSIVLTIDGESPKTQRFTAIGEFEDGHTEDITDRVSWTASPSSLGRFIEVSTLQTAGFGGEGKVYARSGTLLGTAALVVRISRRVVETDARDVNETTFSGMPDDQVPVVVYPYDGVLMPPNLGTVEIQWFRGRDQNSLFEVALQNKVTDLRIYTGCKQVGAGCAYALSRTLWNQMAYSNLGNKEPVAITVRGTSGPGRAVGTSRPVNLKFAREDIRGGIYYWSAERGVSGIYRIDLEKGRVENFYLTSDAPRDHRGGQECIGCHAISHVGDKLSLVLGGAHISDLVQLNVENRLRTLTRIDTTAGRPEVQKQYSNFQSYSRDGDSFVAALRGRLRLVSATTGEDIIASIPTGGNATHPDWSRSGAYLTFTRYSDAHPTNIPNTEGDNTEIFISRGSIVRMAWNGRSFEQPQVLVPERGGQNSYYPSVAPNDGWVVFNRVSGCRNNMTGIDAPCTAYDNVRARIFMVPISGGGEIELRNINRRGPTDTSDDLTNSWPKFSPFRQPAPEGRTVLWVTFSSRRNYGLRITNNHDRNSGRPQLWMAAITVGGEPTSADPSSPPFWIPNQNLETHNHIAQWTEQIIPIIQ